MKRLIKNTTIFSITKTVKIKKIYCICANYNPEVSYPFKKG